MTTVLEPIALPPVIDEHKHVARHTQQLRELEEKLTRATAHRADLVAEQKQIRNTIHTAEVNSLMGSSGGTPDGNDGARLAELDAEIAGAIAEETAIRDALEMSTIIAKGVRRQVEREIHEQMDALIIAKLKPMILAVEDVRAQNLQLQKDVQERALDLLVPNMGFLTMWLQQASGVVGGR